MLPAWMRPFRRHLVRAMPIQIVVEGHPCLDELHEGKIAVMRMYVSTEILQISGEASEGHSFVTRIRIATMTSDGNKEPPAEKLCQCERTKS